MRWHLKTRSRNRDYQFIGGSPDRWWAPFGSDTSFERSTLLLEVDEQKSWRILVSGTPSVRLDRHHTLIRYTIVGQGTCSEDPELALRLISAFLARASRPEETESGDTSPLGSSLDALFNEETIEDWFTDDPSASELRLETETLVQLALNRLPPPSDEATSEDYPDRSWFGSLHLSSCVGQFIERARRLLRGELTGACYCLNLADRPEDLSVDVNERTLALLFDVVDDEEGPRPFKPGTTSGSKKKGHPGQHGRASRAPSSRSPKPGSSASPQPSPARAPDDPADSPRPEGAADPQPLVDNTPTPDPEPIESEPPPAPAPRRILLTDEKTGETVETTEEEIAALLKRRGLPPQVVRGLRDASQIVEGALVVGRGTFQGVRGAIRKTMSESYRTLESGMKEVSTVVKEGASQGAREVFEAVKSMSTTGDEELEGEEEAPTGSHDGVEESTESTETTPQEPLPEGQADAEDEPTISTEEVDLPDLEDDR